MASGNRLPMMCNRLPGLEMASSLGGAFGIALSGTLYGIGAAMVNINFGAMLGLWLNILMAIISFTVILIGVPKQQSK